MTTLRSVLGRMSPERFLREHWQKKPLLVKRAFPAFADPLTPEELAGLACEDGVESRIVQKKGGAHPWEVTWGPQAASVFEELSDRGWTLLVQDVNRWVPEAALLLEPFSFLPSVRVDDVMVSYATPGGSVGPHLDSYDVFLVQGRGERRWRYDSRPTVDRRFVPGLDLRILSRFRPDADEILGPGDMLYLPPGFAHHGVAVTRCMTYSVGFRAPSAGEAWASFAGSRGAGEDARRLLRDPPLRPQDNAGAIPPALLARVRAMIRSIDMSDDAIDRWFASFATCLKPGHELEPPRRPPDASAILARLGRGDRVSRTEEGRWAYLPVERSYSSASGTSKESRSSGRALLLYVGGVELDVPQGAAPLALRLCAARRHEGADVRRLAANAASRALLTRLFGMGALHFVRASSR